MKLWRTDKSNTLFHMKYGLLPELRTAGWPVEKNGHRMSCVDNHHEVNLPRWQKLPDTRRQHSVISCSADTGEASNQHQGYLETPNKEGEDDELTDHDEDEVVDVVVQKLCLVPVEPVPCVKHHQALVQHPDCLTQEENHTQEQNLCSFKILSSAKWYNKKFLELIQNFLLQKIKHKMEDFEKWYILDCAVPFHFHCCSLLHQELYSWL